MARIRTIKPEFFDDPDIGRLSPLAALFFIGLWTQADRAGRLIEEPSRLKHRLCPYWPSDAGPLIDELVEGGFVIRYRDGDGRNLLQIRCFEKHQRPHPKEANSEFPEPAVKKHGKPRKNILSKVDLGREGDLGSGNGSPTVPAKNPPDPRVKAFLTWFQAEYKTRRNGAEYFVRWPKDAPVVKRLLTTYPPERLQRHAKILLTTDDGWIDGTDRGVGILAAKINWLEERLATWEAKQAAKASA
jgi:hypothetical protein